MRRRNARKMSGLAAQFIEQALQSGGCVAIEWPADSGCWDLPEVKEFEAQHCFRRVYFHGCMLGVHGKELHIKKPWCISANDERIIKAFKQYQCDNSHQHEPAEGGQTEQTGYYNKQFVDVVLEAWYPMNFHRNIPNVSFSHGLITRNLKKSEWLIDPKGVQAVRKEAQGLRDNGTWLDDAVKDGQS